VLFKVSPSLKVWFSKDYFSPSFSLQFVSGSGGAEAFKMTGLSRSAGGGSSGSGDISSSHETFESSICDSLSS
jgi:hypothetical protein